MRIRTLFSLILLAIPISLSAQGTAADTTLAAQVNAQLTIIKRDNGAPKYSKTAQDSIAKLVGAHLKKPGPTPPPNDTNAAARVEIHFSAQSVNVGGTMQAQAVVYNASGRVLSTPVAWTSVTPQFATVNSTGLITGVAGGTATIRARADTASTTRTLTVVGTAPIPPPGPVKAIDIQPASLTLTAGASQQLTATLTDSAGNVVSGSVSWVASPTSVATVTSTGLLTGVSAGNVTVTATVPGGVGSFRQYTVVGGTPPVPPNTGTADLAFLPRTTPSAQVPTGYTVIQVAQGQSLQAALDAAPCRAELRLAAGVTFTGNLTLRQKPCNDAIHTVFRSDNAAALLPRGQRITPSLSRSRRHAIIASNNSAPAITANAGAGGYAFEDIEILCTGTQPVNGCVTLGTTQTTLAQVPTNFVFSHVYLTGTPTLDLKRCLYLNAGTTAVVDSWLGECHSNNGDSQAILMLNGPGPYLIENNYLEAGHEVVMFGGGDPSIPGLVPSDVTIRRNHITRPASWKGVWQVKNLLETKNAAYVLIESNVIESNWADGQVGYALLFKSVNQNGTANWSVTKHLTARYNVVRNTGAGMNLCANCQGTVEFANHITAYDNIFTGINCGIYQGEAREWQFLGPLSNIAITHNTTTGSCGVATAVSLSGNVPKITRLMFASNIYDNGQYGVHGDASPYIPNAIDTTQMTWAYNAPVGVTCPMTAPYYDRCFSSAAALGLSANGVLGGANALPSHDSQPIGADAAAVYQRVAGVVVSDPLRGLSRRRVASPRETGYRPTTPAQRAANTRSGPSVR